MICGATLSRWEGGGRFSLAKSTSATAPAAGNRARGTLPSILIPEGRLALEIRLD
jgi:hypothetical protein